MGMRVFLAAALVLLTTIAFAEHAISLDAEPPAAPQAATAPSRATTPAKAERAPDSANVDAANVKVAFPSEMKVHLVETGRREVCDTFDFGDGDVRTECRIEPLPVRAENAALRGICITRYGNRSCY
jgi:hypothetical protein